MSTTNEILRSKPTWKSLRVGDVIIPMSVEGGYGYLVLAASRNGSKVVSLGYGTTHEMRNDDEKLQPELWEVFRAKC